MNARPKKDFSHSKRTPDKRPRASQGGGRITLLTPFVLLDPPQRHPATSEPPLRTLPGNSLADAIVIADVLQPAPEDQAPADRQAESAVFPFALAVPLYLHTPGQQLLLA